MNCSSTGIDAKLKANLMSENDFEALHALRLKRWGQTPETRVADTEAAVSFIERVGVATLFEASPEIPNLYYAYMGDPAAKVASEWDSPAGHVYGWRWELGRPEAAFYTALVRSRPTWISWEMLPAMLRLRGELRSPETIYRAGELSQNAYKIAQTLENSGGVLSTGELRQQAGFPTGKTQRAAYLKAVEELDTRLLLAKVFPTKGEGDGDAMSHALVSLRYAQYIARAERLTRPQALEQFLTAYLLHAVYALPTVLAKHLKLPESEIRDGLDKLVQMGQAIENNLAGQKGKYYVWKEAA